MNEKPKTKNGKSENRGFPFSRRRQRIFLKPNSRRLNKNGEKSCNFSPSGFPILLLKLVLIQQKPVLI
jgi:hypothetical protein